MVDLILVIGTIGMLILLIAFVLNLLKKIMQDSITYNVLNILAGGILAFYAFVLNSIPFLILEIIWTLFALYKLIIVLKK
jgi:hypothetical protein